MSFRHPTTYGYQNGAPFIVPMIHTVLHREIPFRSQINVAMNKHTRIEQHISCTECLNEARFFPSVNPCWPRRIFTLHREQMYCSSRDR